ncbi:MAG: hypothetical protein AAB692_04265, partial [Patescibacteria group bacterium]
MYAAVAPILRMPRGTGLFDYAIPERIAPAVTRGSIVLVPWRGKKTPGLVFGVRERPDIPAARVKPMLDVPPIAFLPEDLVATIEAMALETFASSETVAQAFLPQFLKKMTAPASLAAPAAAAKKIERRLIRYRTAEEKWRRTEDSVRIALSDRRSAIIVVPHSDDVAAAAVRLKKNFGDAKLVALHGDTASAGYRKAWLSCAEPGTPVVIGTRVAVMAPTPNPGLIAIHESDSPDLQQYDQNPRYDVRMAAARRAELAGADLLMMSRFPRLEEYALAAGGSLTFGDDRPAASARLVDISSSAPSALDKILSPAAMEAMEKALQSQKKVILFHNRRGTASALMCKDCRHVFRCPTCETAFIISGDKLECRRCRRTETVPAVCPKCSGAGLRQIGRGTVSIERELAARFPDRRIARIDADQPASDIEATLGACDIAVGTMQLIHALAELRADNHDIGAVIATSIDDLTAFSGFRGQERAARTIAIMADIAAETGAEFMAQCLGPDQPRIRNLLRDYRVFAGAEIAERTRAGYPPAAELVVLTAVGESEEAARLEAARVRGLIEAIVSGGGCE